MQSAPTCRDPTASNLRATPQLCAEHLQNMFGQADDPTASNLMQSAIVFAGDLRHAAEAANAGQKKLETFAGELASLEGGDFKADR